MGVLSKILPDPVLRYLQKTIIPPKTSRGKYLGYTDTLIILRVPKDAPEPAFRLLKDDINLTAGFDRGRSGRILLDQDEPADKHGKRDWEKPSGDLRPLVGHKKEGMEMQEMSAAQRGKQKER
ncbi:MAG: hypothetical protein Q9182_004693 [Xanthomendoza sp. 2 TL-2023]